MLDIVGRRFRFFLISAIVILIGIISLLTVGLKPGIEFSSGSLLTVDFEQEVEQSQLKQELADSGYPNVIIQRTGAGDYLIRTRELSIDDKAQLEEGLEARFGRLTEPEFSSVSPMIATETARTAVIAVVIAAVGILLYVTWAFRRM
ncbi:protein translocase subunit SecF, partial [Chloroflexota bacterium]